MKGRGAICCRRAMRGPRLRRLCSVSFSQHRVLQTQYSEVLVKNTISVVLSNIRGTHFYLRAGLYAFKIRSHRRNQRNEMAFQLSCGCAIALFWCAAYHRNDIFDQAYEKLAHWRRGKFRTPLPRGRGGRWRLRCAASSQTRWHPSQAPCRGSP